VVDGGRPVIAVGGATAAPVLVDTSADLSGGASDEALEEIGEAAFRACEDANGDLHASPEYRRELARVYAKRAVRAALAAD
jgi:CO/xanthine dehydrogenase FAD-binding subunit